MKELNNFVKMVSSNLLHNRLILLVIVAVAMDTLFGVMRAVKERKFNSCFGIDGAIRKISMVMSLVALVIVDCLVSVNLIGFIPDSARTYIGLEVVGIADFFAILYMCYEAVSILKNMYLCGLPVRKVAIATGGFLGKYTDELPNTEKLKEREDKADE